MIIVSPEDAFELPKIWGSSEYNFESTLLKRLGYSFIV
jgi:hypothetical protein